MLKSFTFNLFYLFFFSSVCSQTLKESVNYTDSLVRVNNYDLAMKNYYRIAYFSDSAGKFETYFKMSEILLLKSRYKDAISFLDSAEIYVPTDSLKNILDHQRVKLFILSVQFIQAKILLDSLVKECETDTSFVSKFQYAVIFFGLKDFSKSEYQFLSLLPDSAYYKREKLRNIFENVHSIRKNPDIVSKILSIIIPGSGMIYEGDFRNGVNSMALTGIILFVGINASVKLSVFDGVVAFLPWFLRYYKSGIIKTMKIAERNNNNKMNYIFNEILDVPGISL